MNDTKRLAGAEVIAHLCRELNYTRGHVAKVLRQNQDALKAIQVGGRWRIPEKSVKTLRGLIAQSGPRFKKGETKFDRLNGRRGLR